MQDQQKHRYEVYPVLSLRGMMLFPHMALHFDVARPKSVAALEEAVQKDQKIFLTAQIDPETEDPGEEELYKVGTIAKINQVLTMPDHLLRVSVEGLQRATIISLSNEKNCMFATVQASIGEARGKLSTELQADVMGLKKIFELYAESSRRFSPETIELIQNAEKPGQLADMVASNALTKLEDRQTILEKIKVRERIETLVGMLIEETNLAVIGRGIQERIKAQIDQNQKEYFLREQIRAIQAELGDTDDSELEEYRKKLEATPLNEEAKAKVQKELDKVSRMAPGTPEISISLNYVDWILDLPWGKTTEDNLDLDHAREILDEDHYGLTKVKDRIIEYLAVLSVKKDMKGPILCFVGPPGVGKTSIAKSIARSMGRKLVQVSLGGVRDEAEIRGHRRTYIGAIPGRIIAGMKQAGTMNPVFLFDEIDKMSSDFKGDPASAMLEVLDGEQNSEFRDHYMELPFDLSQVMFITTANNEDSIPPALHDRMEIIEVPSYTEREKLMIAKEHLLPKQIAAHGLSKDKLSVGEEVLRHVIEDYTREAGVRMLERTIGSVVRKATVEMLSKKVSCVQVTEVKLKKYLGAPMYLRDEAEQSDAVGIVNGLAFTAVGGEMLKVECSAMKGSGNLQLTGKLGDVMQESAKAALSWVRSHGDALGIQPDYFKENDIHIHVPEGAVPKDGPSAGVTLTTALVSTICSIPVKHDLAMTGEISLRGRVLPIGGLREKMMAAYRAGMSCVLIPKENLKDLEEISSDVLKKVKVVPVTEIPEVLSYALNHSPLSAEN